jgi:hypothetical protein
LKSNLLIRKANKKTKTIKSLMAISIRNRSMAMKSYSKKLKTKSSRLIKNKNYHGLPSTKSKNKKLTSTTKCKNKSTTSRRSTKSKEFHS